MEKCLNDHRGQIAAVMMEPVMGNGGVVPPKPDYLESVRSLTKDHETLLIFDEVISGLAWPAAVPRNTMAFGPISP